MAFQLKFYFVGTISLQIIFLCLVRGIFASRLDHAITISLIIISGKSLFEVVVIFFAELLLNKLTRWIITRVIFDAMWI